jgi:hypothetical protein
MRNRETLKRHEGIWHGNKQNKWSRQNCDGTKERDLMYEN